MPDHPENRSKVIALCGKGGVGKTVISAAIVKILVNNPKNRVLAIDADPAVGLSMALGIAVKKTVDDIRSELIRRVESGSTESKEELMARLDYEVFSALEEHSNLAFLAIGRPEKEGCYCQVNHILKDIIASMANNFDYVVIDGEAGLEQINRRVMASVSHLILVSDASAKAIHVAQTVQEVAASAIDYEQAGLILNRIRDAKEKDRIVIPPELYCLGWVPEDEIIRRFDVEGRSILDTPDCLALQAIEKSIIRLMGRNIPEYRR